MMRAIPYNLQGKGVVEVSGISISQISSSTPKWRSLDKAVAAEETEFEQLQVPVSTLKANTPRATRSIDSEPTSTLDTTRRSPSSPTSTSTLSSSFTGGKNSGGGGAGAAAPELHHGSDNFTGGGGGVTGSFERGGGGAGGGSGGGGLGLEEWDSMFPNGDGALLPWLMGEADEMGLGLKHLLQSGNPVDDEDNAGLGVVEQGSDLENLSPLPLPLVDGVDCNVGLILSDGANLGFNGSGLGNNGKIGPILPNCSSGIVDCKVDNNGLNPGCNISSSILGSIPAALNFPHSRQFDISNEKPLIFNPQLVMNQQQAQSIANPSFLMSPLGFSQLEQHLFQPQAKRHNLGVVLDPNLGQIVKNPFGEQGHELLLRKQQQQLSLQQLSMGLAHQLVPQHPQSKPLMVSKQSQEQAVKDQLFKAADMIQTGNCSLAEEILARLNHHLSLPAKPLIRAALYLKEALQMILLMSNPVAVPPPKTLTPYDVVHKMNAYKVFSEVSPVTQFVNFTCTQAILEALDDADVIHIIDFDVGCGAQWASLIQELPLRKKGAPSLKITALASLSTSHPFELALIPDNLVQFANDIGVVFELEVVNLDLFDPSLSSMPNIREDEAIAVSIPIWALSNRPSVLPSILRFIKQCSPKIIVSFDRGFDRFDVPFPQHLIHTLESCTNFLESLDGLSVASDIVSKVEKFFIQPKIENTVLGRVHAPDKMPHWKNLFASAGFMPLHFSNFTETQADYVVKRTPTRGFHVEKRQASLVLSWQRRELVAASAWRC